MHYIIPEKIMSNIKFLDEIERIKNLVIEGELEAALRLLTEQTKNGKFEVDSALLLTRFLKFKKSQNRLTIEENAEQREFNKIVIATLEILKKVTVSFFQNDVIYDKILFYITPKEHLLPPKKRIYSSKFKKSEVGFIGWELTMKIPRTKTSISHALKWHIIYPDKTNTPKYTTDFIFDKGWANPWISGSWGNEKIGGMKEGIYNIQIFIHEVVVKEGFFKIY